jgi:cell pole-organizing protein PopZ
MSESGAQTEPSMEDVLASIRRILNEDGEPVADQEPPAPAPALAPALAPVQEHAAPAPVQEHTAELQEDHPQSNVDDIFELDPSMIVEENTVAIAEPPPPPPPPASIPDVSVPEASIPEASIPEASIPEASIPDVSITHASIPHVVEEEEPLLNPVSAAAAGASLGALARVVDQQHQRQFSVYPGGPTLEDIVRQELRPMLKSWLDENLPPMVERMVRAEIERVTGAHS